MLALLPITRVMDDQYIHRVAKLIPFAVKNKSLPTMAFSYHFEPPVDDNGRLGSFFVVIEIMAKQALASQLIDLIIKTIGEIYYNEQYEAEPEERFEKALREVNGQIKQLFSGHDKEWQTKISAIVGIINRDQLIISQAGSATAFLYRNHHTTSLADESTKRTRSDKVFANLTSGQLKPLDRILLATPAVMFQFSLSELREIITDNSPNAAVNKLSSVLADRTNAERCAAIVVEVTTPEIAAETPLTHVPDEVMIGQAPTAINRTKDKAAPVAKKSLHLAKQAAEKTSEFTKERVIPKLKERSKTSWNRLWTEYINPNPRRALVVLACVLVVTFVAISFLGSINPNRAEILKLYSQSLDYKSQGEAALQKGDKLTAKDRLKKAEDRLKAMQKLQTNTDQLNITIQSANPDKPNFSDTSKQVEALLDKSQNISRPNTVQVADLSTVKDGRFSFVASLGTTLFALDTSSGAIYKYDPSEGEAIKVADDEGLKNVVALTASYSGDGVFFLTKDSAVYFFRSATNNLSALRLNSGTWQNGNAIASYLSNLYILSPKQNKVYKYVLSGTRYNEAIYTRGDDASIKTGTGLAINGSVFVSKSSPSVAYFENGYEKPFDVSGLPLITSGIGALSWQNNTATLVGLSLEQDRLIVIGTTTATPQLKSQLIPNGVNKIDSFSATDDTIYILSGNKIYKLNN